MTAFIEYLKIQDAMANLLSFQSMITKVWKIRFLFLLVIFIFPESLLAQKDVVNHLDTLPFLKCKVVVEYEQTIDHYIGTRSGIIESLTVSFTDCPEN